MPSVIEVDMQQDLYFWRFHMEIEINTPGAKKIDLMKRLSKKCTVLSLAITMSVTCAVATYANTNQGQFQNYFIEKVIPTTSATLALNSHGELWVWGRDINGTNVHNFKVMDNVAYVSSCGYFIITNNHELFSWSRRNTNANHNNHGILGNGTNSPIATPVRIMENVSYVFGGGLTKFAITNDGGLYSWGANPDGSLGDGTNTRYRNTPVRIMDNVAYVVERGSTHFAITNNGELYSWGRNEHAQLGIGTSMATENELLQETGRYTSPNRDAPVHIMDNVAQIASSDLATFVITTCGELWGWGVNNSGGSTQTVFGLVGIGETTNTHQLTPVRVMSNVAYMTTAGPLGDVRFAITNDGELYAWGRNDDGAGGGSWLGDGTNIHRNTPIRIMENISNVVTNQGPSFWAFATTNDGEVWGWGANNSNNLTHRRAGLLGDGTNEHRDVPSRVLD